jgi:hypothetical protein
MVVTLLFVSSALLALAAIGVLVVQQRNIATGKIVVDDGYNGPDQVSQTISVIVRYFLKRSIYFRKFCMQYVLHFMVRFMYYIDMFTTYLYAKSRNWFVQNAVKNKGTVSHFWEHLKVYKQEMDKEKTESGE